MKGIVIALILIAATGLAAAPTAAAEGDCTGVFVEVDEPVQARTCAGYCKSCVDEILDRVP